MLTSNNAYSSVSRLEGRAAILQLRYDPLIKFLILKVWKNLIVQEKYNLDQILMKVNWSIKILVEKSFS